MEELMIILEKVDNFTILLFGVVFYVFYKEKIDLLASIKDLKFTCEEIKKQVSDQNKQIEDNTDKNLEAHKELYEMRLNILTKDDFNKLEESVKILHGRINDLRKDFSDINNKIGKLEGVISEKDKHHHESS